MATVFILEDDPDLLNLYTRAVKFRGHDVAFSESAERAINVLHEGFFVPDVAVLDMSMPGLPGTVVVDFIRNRSDYPDLPIIVVSCNDDFRHELQSFDVTFMAKPINLSDLYKAIDQFVA